MRSRPTPITNSTFCNRSSLDRALPPDELKKMVVQGNSSIKSRAKDDTSNNQGIRVEDQIYEMIQYPERNSRTADQAKGNVIRYKAKLYKTFENRKTCAKSGKQSSQR